MNDTTKKRVMVITGSASGLGRALAHQAAARGFSIAVVDVQDELGQQVVNELHEQGIDAAYFHCDVSGADNLKQLKDQVMSRFGQVDVMVNNAGVGSQGVVEHSTEEEWQRQFQINVMGVVRGCQAFIPALRQSEQGAIINVASFAAIALAPGVASYNVAKAGVYALSETLRCELAEDGIHVSVVCPAFFQTNLVQSMHGTDEKVKAQINRWMSRSKYSADDVANMMLDALKQRRFMVLCDRQTTWQYRISRWFPNYFYRQKVKMIKRMFR